MLPTHAIPCFKARSLFSGLAVLALTACADASSAPTIVPPAPLLAKTPAGGPYSAVFADDVNDKLHSDGRGPYLESVHEGGDCTNSLGYRGSGLYQLRTIQNSGPCKAQERGTWRYFSIHLGAGIADLDQDGDSAETVESVPGRLLASGVFGVRATSAPVTIYLFEVLPPNGTTTEDPAWTLKFNASVPATGTGGVRVLEALPGNAAVTITSAAGVVVATVDLPFKLTMTPQ